MQLTEVALSRRDCEELRRQIHALKGSSRSLGAARSAELCTVIENELETGELDSVRALVSELAQVTARTVEELRALRI
jgi:HPt (histidine-containing phosphotransfer) domain-containing protein